jgi:hypothetical protein
VKAMTMKEAKSRTFLRGHLKNGLSRVDSSESIVTVTSFKSRGSVSFGDNATITATTPTTHKRRATTTSARDSVARPGSISKVLHEAGIDEQGMEGDEMLPTIVQTIKRDRRRSTQLAKSVKTATKSRRGKDKVS